jgi:drug/metabolite transporter (DMT)-like permease
MFMGIATPNFGNPLKSECHSPLIQQLMNNGPQTQKPQPNELLLLVSLLGALFLWGGNNAGSKYLLGSWPPYFLGAARFLIAAAIFQILFQIQRAPIRIQIPVPPDASSLQEGKQKLLWIRGGLCLAVYIGVFHAALQRTYASHVALCLGTAPVWGLLMEERPRLTGPSLIRYGAALLALCGVVVLFAPQLNLQEANGNLTGEILGLASSVLWANYARQNRYLAARFPVDRLTASTFWRAAVLLLPLAVGEVIFGGIPPLNLQLGAILLGCALGGGVIAFMLYAKVLQNWTASRVLMFNNLIPISTMLWSWYFLGEPLSAYLWISFLLIGTAVTISQWEMNRATRISLSHVK